MSNRGNHDVSDAWEQFEILVKSLDYDRLVEHVKGMPPDERRKFVNTAALLNRNLANEIYERFGAWAFERYQSRRKT